MKIIVARFGGSGDPQLEKKAALYQKRLPKHWHASELTLKDHQGKSILARKNAGSIWVALDERGKSWSSKDLAAQLQKWIDEPSCREVYFLVGAPYGLSKDVKEKADVIWSLSGLTLPSDFAWLIAWEQLYRAHAIMTGLPYHHE